MCRTLWAGLGQDGTWELALWKAKVLQQPLPWPAWCWACGLEAVVKAGRSDVADCLDPGLDVRASFPEVFQLRHLVSKMILAASDSGSRTPVPQATVGIQADGE